MAAGGHICKTDRNYFRADSTRRPLGQHLRQVLKHLTVVRGEMKNPSLKITVRHKEASLVMSKHYHRDSIYSPYLITLNYIRTHDK